MYMVRPNVLFIALVGKVDGPDERPHIGYPISNLQIYLLDEDMNPLPVGATGEIYVGGRGVAHGYLNRPSLTAEKFVPDPIGGMPGARLYRTGDLGRYLPGGTLQYLGRNDQQIKIRGYRVEPGESVSPHAPAWRQGRAGHGGRFRLRR